MTLRDTALLFVLAALWGASFLFIKVAVPVFGPFALIAGRVLLGGLLLIVYARLVGKTPPLRRRWRAFLLIGLLNNAVPQTLIAFAQLNLTASLAALLNATVPLFSAVIAVFWIQERLTVTKVAGLLLGILGVAIIAGWQPEAVSQSRWVGIALMLTATFFYGLATVYAKVSFVGVDSVAVASGQLLSASLIMVPFAAFNPPPQPVTLLPLLALLGLATLSTAMAYLIYFYLIAHAGPTNAASVTLLIPFFSSVWGALFLGERLHANEILGFGIILISLLLVTGLWQRFGFRRSAPAAV